MSIICEIVVWYWKKTCHEHGDVCTTVPLRRIIPQRLRTIFMTQLNEGSEISCLFFQFGPVLSIFPYNLLHFGDVSHLNGVCSTLRSNLSFSMESATFWCYLLHFGAGSCHFNVFATYFSSNPSFSMEFVTFWCSNCSCNSVICN